ncbi:hypothetical protein BH10CHL1_BH10CHL1_26950 [soil metagenome]
MFHKAKILPNYLALLLVAMLAGSGLLLPATASVALAQTEPMTLTVTGPSYVTPGSNITYAMTVKNVTTQPITNIGIFTALPVNTTYVSGGTFVTGGVEYAVASLAANASQAFTLVVKVGSGIALGTLIDNKDNQIYEYTIGGQPGNTTPFADGVRTTVEAPGTLVASYKNASGRAFDVKVDGFQFQNYSEGPAGRNVNDDLGADDLFQLFGPQACQSGTTAATCVLTAPAKKWMATQIASMNLGHCDGLAATSLRLFDQLPYKGKSSPASFQPGAATTSDLNFPAQSVENYIAHYFVTQSLDPAYDQRTTASPVELVNKLIADFNKATPIPYTIAIFKMPGYQEGHAITAYGVERVNATESRILVYDNNFPKLREYITVNMTANTWRYVTAAHPGQPADVDTGTATGATSGGLSLVPLLARDRPAGQYFDCPFCNQPANAASIQAAAAGMVAGQLSFQYTGEGGLLVINDEHQATGYAFDTETDINEIPNAQLVYAPGGLGFDVPPRIDVPFVEAPSALYSVFVSGKTIDSVANGSLSMTGQGYVLGLDNIQLEPDEFLETLVSPDGDYIAFHAQRTQNAPPLYIAYDPISDTEPSVIFEVNGVILDPGEESALSLDPALERVFFYDTGALGQHLDVTMSFIWPDGHTSEYNQVIDVPVGATSAFVDFQAWDGLLGPSYYIDNVLQNPSINHRLKLESATGTYDPTPQANAPAGVYHGQATFTNVTTVQLTDAYFTIANLGAGNVVLNTTGGPTGVGGEIAVPTTALGDNGYLDPNESFTITFDVGLASAVASELTLAANGEPWQWLPNVEPAPSYDANNANFVFAVNPTDTTPPAATIMLSAAKNGSVAGLKYRDEDIIAYNPDTGQWSVVFDGSDVGLGNADIDAFSFLPNGQLLLSVEKSFTLNGFGAVDDADILRFIPTSYGPNTSGSYALYLDGSDVDLNSGDEDIDAIAFDASGNLVISVKGSFKAQNVKGNDEDLFVLTDFTPGANTSGKWGVYFDGSDVKLGSSGEDIAGLWADHANSKLYLATHDSFSVSGLKGEEEDIFVCQYTSLGTDTACTFSSFWQGENFGFDDAIDGLAIGAAPTVVSAAEDGSSVAVDDTVEFEGDDIDEPNPLDGEEIEDEAVLNSHLFLPLVQR